MKLDTTARWAEVLGNIGVVVTLVLLLVQIQDNTQVLRSQAFVDRGAALNEPFLSATELPAIIAKIKAVDGEHPMIRAYMDRYDLSYAEGEIWSRHVLSQWITLEAEYTMVGDSPALASRVSQFLGFPDQQIWFENGGPAWLSNPDFRTYMDRAIQGL